MANDEDVITGEELGNMLLTSIRQMKAGEGTVVHSPAIVARQAHRAFAIPFCRAVGCLGANAPRMGARASPTERCSTNLVQGG